MNRFRYLKNVSTLQLDEQVCIGCGKCVEVCPHAVLRLEEKTAQIQDRDACMECGACAKNCPVAAVTVNAGVGCAAAVISQLIGRTDGCCCGPADVKPSRSGCC